MQEEETKKEEEPMIVRKYSLISNTHTQFPILDLKKNKLRLIYKKNTREKLSE